MDEQHSYLPKSVIKKWYKNYTILTLDIIRKKYWNPITKKGTPIKFISLQFIEDFDKEDIEIMTPTGDLIIKNNDEETILKDWLSNNTSGPYLDHNESGKVFYYIVMSGRCDGDCDCYPNFHNKIGCANVLQIGWNGGESGKVNNYISDSVINGIDCWISTKDI